MTQEESLVRAKRKLKSAKTGKEVAAAMMGHFKNMVVKEKSLHLEEALVEYSTPLLDSHNVV